jgi:hypothetical protein
MSRRAQISSRRKWKKERILIERMKERKQEKERERKKERKKERREKERKIPANCRVDQLLVFYN